MYEIIENNQYGELVKNTTGTVACIHCKYERGKCGEAHNYCKLNPLYYFLPDSEAEKLESKTSDTQKELIDLRVELRVEKEKSKALEEYSRGLELKVKELEGTIENNVTETKIEIQQIKKMNFHIEKTVCCNFVVRKNFNYCPNCGRKIKK